MFKGQKRSDAYPLYYTIKKKTQYSAITPMLSYAELPGFAFVKSNTAPITLLLLSDSPLGMARSGRSIRSKLASKTSLKTIPHRINKLWSNTQYYGKPMTATAAVNTPAMQYLLIHQPTEVMILAGRIIVNK